MSFDFKKEYKEFYMPKNKPSIVEIPRMNYIAVRGIGNPNEENGDYQNTIGLLYGVAYTIKMSYKGTHKIEGFLDFEWAIEEATKKKKQDFSRVEFLTYEEGLCVQCMHIGSYNDEPATVNAMHEYMKENGYELDITDERYHHEIYLSDPRKCDNNKLKTVIRHPIKKINRDSTNHF